MFLAIHTFESDKVVKGMMDHTDKYHFPLHFLNINEKPFLFPYQNGVYNLILAYSSLQAHSVSEFWEL